MQNENARNTIIFVVLSLLIYLGYVQFVMQPRLKAQHAATAAAARVRGGEASRRHPARRSPQTGSGEDVASRAWALAATQRVPIATPRCAARSRCRARASTIFPCAIRASNQGAKGDKVHPCYTVSAEDKSPDESPFHSGRREVRLFRQPGLALDHRDRSPPADAGLEAGLRPDALAGPLRWCWATTSADGALSFRRTISVDDNYMFSIADTVTNKGAAAVTLEPYGEVQRQGVPDTVLKSATNVQQGGVGYLQDDTKMVAYRSWPKKKAADESFAPKDGFKGGWIRHHRHLLDGRAGSRIKPKKPITGKVH